MPTMLHLMRAVRGSSLPAPDRHILMTLASLADPITGIIPERFMPSLTNLEHFTGLGRSTIARGLNNTEKAGWVKRTVPTKAAARQRKERTSYLLTIPEGAAVADDDDPDGASATAGLVPQRDQLGGWSHSGTSATAGLELVPQRDQASATAGHVVPEPCVPANHPLSAREGARDDEGFAPDDPCALFSVPGQRTAEPETGTTKTAPKKPAAGKRKRMSRETTKNPETLPADWHVSEEMEAWAKDKAPNVIQRLATDKFLVHFGDAGKRMKDWDSAWRKWILGDQQRFEERANSPAQNGSGYASNGAGSHNRQRNQHIPYRDPEDISRYKTSKI